MSRSSTHSLFQEHLDDSQAIASNPAMEPYRPVQMDGQGFGEDTEYKSEKYRSTQYAANDNVSSYDARSVAEQSLLSPESKAIKSKPKARGVPHWLRIVLRVLSLLLAVTIIGLIANILFIYRQNSKAAWKYEHGNRLNSWPSPMNWVPTTFMLAAASLVGLLNIIVLASLLGCFKQIKVSSLGRFTGLVSSAIAAAAWIAAVAYYKAWDTKAKAQYDMWSWTCSHKYIKLRQGGKVVGLDFFCAQLTYVFFAGIAIAVLEVVGLVAYAYNMRVNGRAEREQVQGEYKQIDS